MHVKIITNIIRGASKNRLEKLNKLSTFNKKNEYLKKTYNDIKLSIWLLMSQEEKL
jgi:hypothetical protein